MKKNEIILRVLKDLYESVEDKERAWFMGDKFLVREFPPYGFTGARGLRNAQQYAQDEIIERKIVDGYVYFRWSPTLWDKHCQKSRELFNKKLISSQGGYK